MIIPVVIVGGGLAGLYAGFLLQRQNIEFKIVEAGPQPGGRIFSLPHSSGSDIDLQVDLGPSWFWPHQTEMLNLMQSLQVDYFQQYHQGEALFQADASTPIERFMPSYMESFRVTGGMLRLVESLVDKLPEQALELNYRVSEIKQVDNGWQLTDEDSCNPDYLASKVLIATPPRVIVDRIEFPNELQSLKAALSRLPTWMAAQAKFVATYETPFWREQGLSGQAFSRLGPMVEIHDSSATDNSGFAIFGFIGVPAGSRRQVAADELKQACLAQLGQIFGEPALNCEESYLVDWAENDLVASPADLAEQPNHPQIDLSSYRQALLDAGLYFAGSEVASRDAGYLQGAIIAASEAVAAMFSGEPKI